VVASRIVQVFVKEGETVTAGTPLVMVEAMKTVRPLPPLRSSHYLRVEQEHVLRAPKDGIVSRVIATVGELVPEGKVLVEFEEEDEVKE
jgi:3-methylcrotonyl-CoA carboxylase alpha subunit